MKYFNLLILVIIFSSCSEKTSNPVIPEEKENFVLSSIKDTIKVFPGGSKKIELTVISGEFESYEIETQTVNYEDFEVNGPWFLDNTCTKISMNVWGHQVSANPKTVIFPVIIDGQIFNVPLTVVVPDFYLANRFLTNANNDTITIPKGGNFLLKITCLDTANNVTPKSIIEPFGLGIQCGIWQNNSDPKFVVSSVNRDTINYYFMFAAFSDIFPSDDDSNLSFTFYLSNKNIRLPIKINYN